MEAVQEWPGSPPSQPSTPWARWLPTGPGTVEYEPGAPVSGWWGDLAFNMADSNWAIRLVGNRVGLGNAVSPRPDPRAPGVGRGVAGRGLRRRPGCPPGCCM